MTTKYHIVVGNKKIEKGKVKKTKDRTEGMFSILIEDPKYDEEALKFIKSKYDN